MKNFLLPVLSASLIALYGAGNSSSFYDVPDNTTVSYSAEKISEQKFITKTAENENGEKYIIISGIKETPEELIIPESIDGIQVLEIETNAFQFNTKIKKLVISEGVEKIGYAAFAECTSLDTVEIPQSVTEISAASFNNTAWLNFRRSYEKYIVDGDNVLMVYNGHDEDVILPDYIKRIGREAFYGNSTVKSVKFGEDVKQIDRYAFSDCPNLASVKISSDIEEIGEFAFWNCGLKKVSVPKSVKKIGPMAFGYFINTDSKITGPVSGFEITGYLGSAAEWYATENSFVFREYEDKYDINGDCEIDIRDVLSVKKSVLSGKKSENTENTEISDLNADGKTDVFDVIRAKRLIIG